MTPQEIENSRNYIRGYWCGYRYESSASLNQDSHFIMGWKDGEGDREECVPCFVATSAGPWAELRISGLLIGAISKPGSQSIGNSLYFEVLTRDDPVAQSLFQWSNPHKSWVRLR